MPLNIVVNWQDRENPHAGGAEIHLFEIFGRLAARGHRVRLVCSGWPGAAPRTTLDGIAVERTGTPEQLRAARPRRGAPGARGRSRPDVVVEDINKLPLFLAGMTDRPFCAIVPHLFGTTAFEEAPWPMAATVWAAERPLARAYAPGGVPRDQREHPRRPRRARRARRADPGDPSRASTARRYTPGPRAAARRRADLLVRWTVEAL